MNTNTLSCELIISAALVTPTTEGQQLLQGCLDTFVQAIQLGIFRTGVLLGTPEYLQQTTKQLLLSLSVHDLPSSALRVLNGMLQARTKKMGGLALCEIKRKGSHENLLLKSHSNAEVPVYPFRQTRKIAMGVAPAINVRVDFAEAVPSLDTWCKPQLQIWEQVLFGGFPHPLSELGESIVGPTRMVLFGPRVLEYRIAGYLADDEGLNALCDLFRRWNEKYPIRTVSFL